MKHLTLSFFIRFIILILLGLALTKEILTTLQSKSDATNYSLEAEARSGTDSNTQSLRALKQTGADDIASVDAAALTKSRLVDVISTIESEGKTLGLALTIGSLSGTTPNATGTPYTVQISIDATGPWGANITLLHLLQSLPYKSSVDVAKLAESGNAWRGSYTLALTILNQ